jgi:hypothetical protein
VITAADVVIAVVARLVVSKNAMLMVTI